MKRRTFLQTIIGGLMALFVKPAKPQQLGQRRSGYRPLISLDCGEAECVNYRWLGCHGCDDPMNQSACALPLKKGYECLRSEDHIWFESYKGINLFFVLPASYAHWWNIVFIKELRKGIYPTLNERYLSGFAYGYIELKYITDWHPSSKLLHEDVCRLARSCAKEIPPQERGASKISLFFEDTTKGPQILGWKYENRKKIKTLRVLLNSPRGA